MQLQRQDRVKIFSLTKNLLFFFLPFRNFFINTEHLTIDATGTDIMIKIFGVINSNEYNTESIKTEKN